MSLLCRIGWHAWKAWLTEENRVFGFTNTLIRQTRACVRCNKTQARSRTY